MNSRRTPLRASLDQLAKDFGAALLDALRNASFAEVEELQSTTLEPALPVSLGSSPSSAAYPRGVLAKLTARERDVFDRVLHGGSNAEIARDLGVSVKTVQTHRAKVNRKLGFHSGSELVRFGALHGLLKTGPDGPARVPSPKRDAREPFPVFNLAELERRAIAAALRATKGNRNRAAALLGIPRSALLTKLRPDPALVHPSDEPAAERLQAATQRIKRRLQRSPPYRRNAAQLANELAPLAGPSLETADGDSRAPLVAPEPEVL